MVNTALTFFSLMFQKICNYRKLHYFGAFFLRFEALMKNHQANKQKLSYCRLVLDRQQWKFHSILQVVQILVLPPRNQRTFSARKICSQPFTFLLLALREAFHSPTKSVCGTKRGELPPHSATSSFPSDAGVVKLQHKSGVKSSLEELQMKQNKDITIGSVSISRDGHRGKTRSRAASSSSSWLLNRL